MKRHKKYALFLLMIASLSCESLFNTFAFFPDTKFFLDKKDLPEHCTELSLVTSDKIHIQALYFKQSGQHKKLVINFHGNAGNLYHRINESLNIFNCGCDVLLLGYRGYGKSEGKPNENGVYIDGQCVYDYAVTTLGYTSENILLYGRSLGTTVAVHTAQNRKIRGLILITPLSTAEDFARAKNMGSFGSIAKDKFVSIEKMKNITCPLLVIHGTNDEVIPSALGKKLYDEYKGKKDFVTIINGHHNDLEFVNPALYWKSVSEFISQ
jgi:fermentation-respiration switch protein FrsA (DUF1100 family)